MLDGLQAKVPARFGIGSWQGGDAVPTTTRIVIRGLTREAYAPFGWILGSRPVSQNQDYLDGKDLTAWHEHNFQPGEGGVVEFVWIEYKRGGFSISRLESHRLTEQALIPVSGKPMVHVVCPPPDDPLKNHIAPDLDRMMAFLLDGSRGVCMRRGCWHDHFPLVDQVTYLMVTRRSTQVDIQNARETGGTPTETVMVDLSRLTDMVFELVL